VERFSAAAPDALILDVGLPDSDGRDVCQALRAHGMAAPVIFLTKHKTLPDRLSGFHVGGDDYVTKPYAIEELLLRLDAVLQRAPKFRADAPPSLRFDPVAHTVSTGGAQPQGLTPTEFRVLAALAAHRGKVLRRCDLERVGWTHDAIVNPNTLDTYIARLRRKLAAVDRVHTIETRRGVGYVLQ